MLSRATVPRRRVQTSIARLGVEDGVVAAAAAPDHQPDRQLAVALAGQAERAAVEQVDDCSGCAAGARWRRRTRRRRRAAARAAGRRSARSATAARRSRAARRPCARSRRAARRPGRCSRRRSSSRRAGCAGRRAGRSRPRARPASGGGRPSSRPAAKPPVALIDATSASGGSSIVSIRAPAADSVARLRSKARATVGSRPSSMSRARHREAPGVERPTLRSRTVRRGEHLVQRRPRRAPIASSPRRCRASATAAPRRRSAPAAPCS